MICCSSISGIYTIYAFLKCYHGRKKACQVFLATLLKCIKAVQVISWLYQVHFKGITLTRLQHELGMLIGVEVTIFIFIVTIDGENNCLYSSKTQKGGIYSSYTWDSIHGLNIHQHISISLSRPNTLLGGTEVVWVLLVDDVTILFDTLLIFSQVAGRLSNKRNLSPSLISFSILFTMAFRFAFDSIGTLKFLNIRTSCKSKV